VAAEGKSSSPKPDLGLLFGTNAVDLEARRIFVDRVGEQQAFDNAVTAHYESTRRPEFDPQDVTAPRRNVLTYYGVGGVGKTSLSRELEQRHGSGESPAAADWPSWDKGFKRSVTARFDLANDVGFDLERVLINLRVAVSAIGRPMHAFDIALGRYWQEVHRNESLADYMRADSRMSRVAEALKVPDQILEGLKEVAGVFGGPTVAVSLASQLAVTITKETRHRVAKRHAVQNCRRLVPLLESDADLESLSYYPHLLAWDLAQAAKRRDYNFHIAAFLDTFEDIMRADQRQFERLINRLAWLMPNVLFIVTSRNRLEWADALAEGYLDFAGPVRWPGLDLGATGEPSQHLVGYLSEADANKFLSERLRRDGSAAIPEPVRHKIAHDSEGYPLYLDLAVTHYLQLVESDTEPGVDDFTGGFPALVNRVLRDLSPEERRLIRILSLLDSFDARLAAAIASLPSEAAANALVNRAFVDVDESAPLPYAIHRLLREQVRQSDSGRDAFSAADWKRYAGRAFEELGVRFNETRATRNRPLVISLLNQALGIADEFDLEVGWMADAAYSYISDPLWENSLRPLVRTPPVTEAGALARALIAITNRQFEGRGQTAIVLTEVLDSGLLTGTSLDLATYYAAESFREIGQGQRSEELLRTLLSRETPIADLAVRGMVHRLRRNGRFIEALEMIRTRPESAMWIQITGTLYWSQGMLDEARTAYITSRDRSQAEGLPGQAAEIAGCLAFVCGLSASHDDDADLIAAAMMMLQDSRNTWARLMARLGTTMLVASGQASVSGQLAAIEEDGRKAGLSSIEAYSRFLDCLNAALSGDDDRLIAARNHLAELAGADFRWLTEVVAFWLGDGPSADSELDWLDGADAACERWREVVTRRRQQGVSRSGSSAAS